MKDLDKTTLSELIALGDEPQQRPEQANDIERSEAVILLERIERNTAMMPKAFRNFKEKSSVTKKDSAAAKPVLDAEPRRQRKSDEGTKKLQLPAEMPVATETTKQATAIGKRTAEAQEKAERDDGGRFKSAGEKERDKQREEKQTSGVLGALKAGLGAIFDKDSGQTVKDAAGQAAGGPIYEAAKELYEAGAEFKRDVDDENSLFGKAQGWFKKKSEEETRTGRIFKRIGGFFGRRKDPATVAIEKTEKAEQKRHRELVRKVDGIEPGAAAEGGGLLDGLPTKLPGAAMAGTLAAGAAATAAVGSAVYSLFTGKDNIISKGAQKLGLVPKISEEGSYDINGGMPTAIANETGAKNLKDASATISTGKGDAGGKSYGMYQLSSQRGEVDRFLKSSGYGEQFKGLKTGTAEFDAKWKEVAGKADFIKAQETYTQQSKVAPQLEKLKKAGVDLSGRGKSVQEMILSTSNQYGADSSVVGRALKGRDVSAMSDAEIVAAVQDNKAANVTKDFRSSSTEVQAGVAGRIQREKKELLAMTGETSTATAAAKPASIRQTEGVAQPKAATDVTPTQTVAVASTVKPIAQPVPAEKKVTPQKIEGMETLVASLDRKPEPRKAQQPGAYGPPPIRTEFDDTLITLIAYDRV